MKSRATRVAQKNPAPRSDAANAVEGALRRTFTATVVDELREQTGYNPRQRLITAQRLMLVVVEGLSDGANAGVYRNSSHSSCGASASTFGPARFRSASSSPQRRPSSVRRLSDWSHR